MDRSHTSVLVRGFTLVELLIVIAIISLLALIVLISTRGSVQLAKARDSRRKGDFSKIQRCLEEYYNDHGYYLQSSQFTCRGTGLSPCTAQIPCDPSNKAYQYETDASTKPGWYRLYTNFEYTSDPLISSSGCGGGCSLGGSTYNYVAPSVNAPPLITPTPTPGGGGGSCAGQVAPICGQPQNYVGQCGACCPGAGYRIQQIGGSYYCCTDATCQ